MEDVGDGAVYCDTCGLAPRAASSPADAGPPGTTRTRGTTGGPPTARLVPVRGSGRTGSGASGGTGRGRLGAGVLSVPPVPRPDPRAAVPADPRVPEGKRYCGRCDAPVGRSLGDRPGRTEGRCTACGTPYSFAPKLRPGDVVHGQYEVAGCLAHGGLGWIYLAVDRAVSDRWVVLKGLLDTGDPDALAAAVAERRFLAEIEHPNIVRIYNFVEHRDPRSGTLDGYIVMEYVGGKSLRQIANERYTPDGRRDPLPVGQAVAYGIEALEALAHLHSRGLLYCDFKVDNAIQQEDRLKLIDLGAVRRVDDLTSPIFGTPGCQAPEVTTAGPSVASDLYTVARTLAVLTFDFQGYTTVFAHSLPDPAHIEVFRRHESFHRLLLRATDPDPARRFGSAEEMADQLTGVLREVVALTTNTPRPALSTLFGPEPRVPDPEVVAPRAPSPTPRPPREGRLRRVRLPGRGRHPERASRWPSGPDVPAPHAPEGAQLPEPALRAERVRQPGRGEPKTPGPGRPNTHAPAGPYAPDPDGPPTPRAEHRQRPGLGTPNAPGPGRPNTHAPAGPHTQRPHLPHPTESSVHVRPLDGAVAGLVLPVPHVDPGDPAAAFLAGLAGAPPGQVLAALAGAPASGSVERWLRELRARLELGQREAVAEVLAALERRHPEDWRVVWYRGVAALTDGDHAAAAVAFDAVYDAFPGEPAPKLALAVCAEALGRPEEAAGYYRLVWTTDHAYVSAAFGLARVLLARGERAEAVAVLESVPESSAYCAAARVAAVRARLRGRSPDEPLLPELLAAARQIELLTAAGIDPVRRETLVTEVLGTALDWVLAGRQGAAPGTVPQTALLGDGVTERELRLGLERSYRVLARLAQRGEERIELVERANRVRPRTWV
nr:serine/threonine-protein kinase [Streptomyces sp. SID5468]